MSQEAILRRNKHQTLTYLEFNLGKGGEIYISYNGEYSSSKNKNDSRIEDKNNHSESGGLMSALTSDTQNESLLKVGHRINWRRISWISSMDFKKNSSNQLILRSNLTHIDSSRSEASLDMSSEDANQNYTINTQLDYQIAKGWVEHMSLGYTVSFNKGEIYQLSQDLIKRERDTLNTYQYDSHTTQHQIRLSAIKFNGSINYNLYFGPTITLLKDIQTDILQKKAHTFQSWNLDGQISWPHLTSQMSFEVNISINSRTPNIQQLREIINNANPYFISVGNPSLQQAHDYRIKLSHEWKLDKYGKRISTSLSSGIVENEIVSRYWYYQQPTWLQTWNYWTGSNSTVSSYDNINGTWDVGGKSDFTWPFSKIRSSLTLSISDSFRHNPYYYNGKRNITNINQLLGRMVLKSSLIPQTVLSVNNAFSYTTAGATGDQQRNSIITNSMSTNIRIKRIMKYFFINAQYNLKLQRHVELNRIERENMLNAYIGIHLFKNRGELGIIAYDILNNGNKFLFRAIDNYTETKETKNFGRFIAVNFMWSFRKLNSTRSDIRKYRTF